MPFSKRLLLAIRPGRSQSPPHALQRAALIAERLGLKVELLLPAPGEADPDQLQTLVDNLRARGIAVEAHRKWQGSFHTTVLHALREGGAGLLVKEADPPSALEGLVTPRDWKLMRFAPCPVLLVKQSRAWDGRPILAAVDANPHDADHAELNRQILHTAARIAATTGAPLHVVSAYSTAMQGSDLEQERSDAKIARYRQACEALCQGLEVAPAAIRLGEGPPESWVARSERELDAALVVMGTVARRGIQSLLMGGNTAEVILNRIEADTLTLKPQGTDELLALLFDKEEVDDELEL